MRASIKKRLRLIMFMTVIAVLATGRQVNAGGSSGSSGGIRVFLDAKGSGMSSSYGGKLMWNGSVDRINYLLYIIDENANPIKDNKVLELEASQCSREASGYSDEQGWNAGWMNRMENLGDYSIYGGGLVTEKCVGRKPVKNDISVTVDKPKTGGGGGEHDDGGGSGHVQSAESPHTTSSLSTVSVASNKLNGLAASVSASNGTWSTAGTYEKILSFFNSVDDKGHTTDPKIIDLLDAYGALGDKTEAMEKFRKKQWFVAIEPITLIGLNAKGKGILTDVNQSYIRDAMLRETALRKKTLLEAVEWLDENGKLDSYVSPVVYYGTVTGIVSAFKNSGYNLKDGLESSNATFINELADSLKVTEKHGNYLPSNVDARAPYSSSQIIGKSKAPGWGIFEIEIPPIHTYDIKTKPHGPHDPEEPDGDVLQGKATIKKLYYDVYIEQDTKTGIRRFKKIQQVGGTYQQVNVTNYIDIMDESEPTGYSLEDWTDRNASAVMPRLDVIYKGNAYYLSPQGTHNMSKNGAGVFELGKNATVTLLLVREHFTKAKLPEDNFKISEATLMERVFFTETKESIKLSQNAFEWTAPRFASCSGHSCSGHYVSGDPGYTWYHYGSCSYGQHVIEGKIALTIQNTTLSSSYSSDASTHGKIYVDVKDDEKLTAIPVKYNANYTDLSQAIPYSWETERENTGNDTKSNSGYSYCTLLSRAKHDKVVVASWKNVAGAKSILGRAGFKIGNKGAESEEVGTGNFIVNFGCNFVGLGYSESLSKKQDNIELDELDYDEVKKYLKYTSFHGNEKLYEAMYNAVESKYGSDYAENPEKYTLPENRNKFKFTDPNVNKKVEMEFRSKEAKNNKIDSKNPSYLAWHKYYEKCIVDATTKYKTDLLKEKGAEINKNGYESNNGVYVDLQTESQHDSGGTFGCGQSYGICTHYSSYSFNNSSSFSRDNSLKVTIDCHVARKSIGYGNSYKPYAGKVSAGAITFYPYCEMVYDTIPEEYEQGGNQTAYVMGQHQRKIQLYSRAWANVVPSSKGIKINSVQWSTHETVNKALENAEYDADKDYGALPGGATFTLSTPSSTSEMAKIEIHSLSSVLEGAGLSQVNATGSYNGLNKATAISNHNNMASAIEGQLRQKLRIIQWVTKNPKRNPMNGTNLTNATTFDGRKLSTSNKYYFTSDGERWKDTHLEIVSKKKTSSAVFKTTTRSAKVQGSLGLGEDEINKATGVYDALRSLEHGKGNDDTPSWAKAGNGQGNAEGKWYNEAFDGITVLHQTTTLYIGLIEPVLRESTSDPVLTPKQRRNNNTDEQGKFDIGTKLWASRFSSDLMRGTVTGHFNGQGNTDAPNSASFVVITPSQARTLYTSKKFYIPNITTQDLN